MTSLEALFDERAGRAGLTVPPTVKRSLLAYYEVLFRWNRKINLTALSDPTAAIDRLLLEPVSAAVHLPAATPMADLGSGGGSPAIPLALALHAPSLLMVESRSRKAAFLREASREVGISSVVEAVRFEQLTHRHDGSVGLVSIRAVTPNEAVLTLAKRLCQPSGVIAVFGSSDEVVSSTPWGLSKRSTWNIQPSGMLITIQVETS
jgi:16S rRNA (guanine527-N7)-methyltransferase